MRKHRENHDHFRPHFRPHPRFRPHPHFPAPSRSGRTAHPTHGVFLFGTAILAFVGIGLFQTTPSRTDAGDAGKMASIFSSQLAVEGLSGIPSSRIAGFTAPSGPLGGIDIALASFDLPVPAAAPAAAPPPLAAPPLPTSAPAVAPAPTVASAPPAPPGPSVAPPYVPAGGVWAELRGCESSGNYEENSGNGYYGAYQFSLATWEAIGYSGLPSNAPASIQDEAAMQLQARSGWGQWPQCARELGLT